MNQSDDYSSLTAKIKKGNTASLELLFRRLYPKLCAYANKFLNSMDDAEDVVQDTFFKLYQNKGNLDETKSIQSYLFTSVRNGCLNLLTHKKTVNQYARLMSVVYLQPKGEFTPHETLVATDIEKDFKLALEQLPQQCRTIFELSRFEGIKYQEIAEKLNISIKTVETQMSRALFKIRTQLKDHLISASSVIAIITKNFLH